MIGATHFGATLGEAGLRGTSGPAASTIGEFITVAVSVGWSAWAFALMFRRRPRSVHPQLETVFVDRCGTVGREPWVTRLGQWAQRRIPVLAHLPTVLVGLGAAGVVALMPVAPGMSMVGAVGVVTAAGARSISRQRCRRARERTQVPDVLDLLAVCLASGDTPRVAVSRIAPVVHPPLGERFEPLLDGLDDGEPLHQAIEVWLVTGHPLRELAQCVRQAERSGGPIGEHVAQLARDARVDVRRDLQTRARRLPVQLLVPLVVCVLPAFVLVAVVPAVLRGISAVLA